MKTRHNLVAILLVLSLPFGVAAQNAVSILVLILLAMNPKTAQAPWTWRDLMVVVLPLALCLWTMIATIVNSKNPSQHVGQYLFGFLPLALLPVLAAYRPMPLLVRKPLVFQWAVGVVIFWAVVVFSQHLWGWSLQNPRGGVDFRPFGFFSHPLTLAYAALLLWPWALAKLFHNPRWTPAWLAVISIALILFYSGSRACQALAYGALLWNLLTRLRGKARMAVVLAFILGAVATFATDNPVSRRFTHLIASENPDRFSDYPDDRLAFWHAHWEMVKERPVLGHGMHLRHSYRQPYYETLGLGDFKKQYEAHNQYLQIWADGGLIGLAIFTLWLFFLWQLGKRLPSSLASPFLQMLVVFGAGALVQNAYYDSEVRHIFTCSLIFIAFVLREEFDEEQRKAAKA
ncbi:O-antigen ligase family protein [Pseudobacteriovorax antillogorgiicola]|uniref:O-antigen ligase n=1 Tax=Pseudobacteriovorax antillogorgiicola TaxID=1513793 RepID=A0A1Y6BP80_9BACT|nr:O-antigen ligase family protein [Pseudobacteriovorax antillogorgiicola]TCS55347.1 O-antigen ligase [Pseudobacteriovorax antillogorgiicola]SMF13808.1 O-antigen ligase [Pseudobacteriovorax antillogorgiicola]